jgi:hypothetical protein
VADVGNVVEVFSAPLEGLIAALGRDISSAQAELDRNALKAQEEIDSDPQLAGLGLQAPWHQLPRVDFQLKLALSTAAEAPAERAGAGAQLRPSAIRLLAQPVSAAYQNHFNYDVSGSSELSISLVPVPPPQVAAESTMPARLAPEDAQSLALRVRGAGFRKRRGEPASGFRLDTNFNPLTREWFVLQYDPKAPDKRPVVAAVDDATGAVRVIRS